MEQCDDRCRFKLVAPRFEPDRGDIVGPLQRFVRFEFRAAAVLWALAGQPILKLVEEARLAGAPVSMDAEDLRRSAFSNGVRELKEKRPAIEEHLAVQPELRFVIDRIEERGHKSCAGSRHAAGRLAEARCGGEKKKDKEGGKHRTLNFEHRTPKVRRFGGSEVFPNLRCSAFSVRRSMFLLRLPRRGISPARGESLFRLAVYR